MGVSKEYQVASPKHTEVEVTPAIAAAREAVAAAPDDVQAWMELGLAYAGSTYMREAVDAYSRAIALDPFCGILYRHRGHRHISCWEFTEAAADFEVAARIIPENWDVWYHLGLSYYLLGLYDKAQAAYRRCLELTDMEDIEAYPAIIDWSWRTARRRGDEAYADELLAMLPDDFPVDTDECGYALNCAVYQGRVTPEQALEAAAKGDSLHAITNAYAIGNYYREMGDAARADEVLNEAIAANIEDNWCAFGFLAAMVDMGKIPEA